MRGRPWVLVPAVMVVTAVLAGCTDGGDGEAAPTTPTTAATSGDPGRAPVAFVSGGDGGWGLVGATHDHLVGLGGPAANGDRFGQSVDLTTGATRDLAPPPLAEGAFELVDAAFGETGVVVAGWVRTDDIPVESGGPIVPVPHATYRLDPGDGTWRGLTLPAPYRSGTSNPTVEATGVDGAVLHQWVDDQVRWGPALLALDDEADTWRVVAPAPEGTEGEAPTPTYDGSIGSGTCATDAEWWELTGEGAGFLLTATDLDDGSTRQVPLDATDTGTMALELGCSATHASVSMIDGIVSDLDVIVVDGDRPVRTDAVRSAIIVTYPASLSGGTAGPLLRAVAVPPGEPLPDPNEGEDASAVVTADGQPVPVDLGPAGTTVVWRGRGDELVVLDPPDRADDDDTVAFGLVAVPTS